MGESTREVLDLLVVDDDQVLREEFERFFSRQGDRVVCCGNGQEALEKAGQRAFDVAVVDMVMPGLSGLELLERLKEVSSECEVVMLTGQGTIETAVEAMKLGAQEYLTKPIRLRELEAVVRKAYGAGQLRRENDRLREVLRKQRQPSTMIGDSPPMREVFRLIQRTAGSDKPILIQGESGTGKELVARGLHEASQVADKPLVVINCAALPETLLESELFGHEKGAFTGAVSAKPGLFEVADGGTLFIDEVGELAGPLQAKLLRVLEDGTLRRIGSIKERRVRVRLLAASNRDMQKEVEEGRFREDLFYRINVLTLQLPPLRQRPGDLPLLLQHFVGDGWHIDPDVLPLLEQYSWPGNVRQLQNAIQRAKILAEEDVISVDNLPPEIVRSVRSVPRTTPAGGEVDLDTLTRLHVLETYQRHHGNKARTARSLGISRRSLYRLLQKYDIPEVV